MNNKTSFGKGRVTSGVTNAQVSEAAKPSNEELSTLYNSCVKLLNENKINVKNAFQLKLIDYMSDILLSKEIVGGETNFQVVGCTIDVGTKIYAARVDALHKNTYQVLSGLGHAGSEEAEGEKEGENDVTRADTGNHTMANNDDEEEGTAKKVKAKKRRNKKSSQIAENLDSITSKTVEDFKDVKIFLLKLVPRLLRQNL